MDRNVPAPAPNERLSQSTLGPSIEATIQAPPQRDSGLAEVSADDDPASHSEILDQIAQLQPSAQVSLLCRLLTHLDADQIQRLMESGQQVLTERQRRGGTTLPTVSPNTRLVLKKDYTYQDRGLSQPTQYYVYLRRCKPKLDRYIGTLFYIPQGCALSYFLDTEGCIVFNPPHNVFQLSDCKNPADVQVVRLICLQPPPIEYTFTKQQKDTPAIYLHVEYLDAHTHAPISTQTYLFPACMHEGGQLDRYRWEVLPLTLSTEVALNPEADNVWDTSAPVSLIPLPTVANPIEPDAADLNPEPFEPTGPIASEAPPDRLPPAWQNTANRHPKVTQRGLEFPAPKFPTFYLTSSSDADLILKRMLLWVSWSEKALPQTWGIIQEGKAYRLVNAQAKRRILKFSAESGAVTLESSLAVVVKCFHELGLAVSQTQNQKRYSAAQLKIAVSLFVDMSLPQKDPVVVLKQLFGVEFTAQVPERS
jgi:hypothetical protein